MFINTRRVYDIGRVKAMRRRIALQKHCVRNLREMLICFAKRWECARVLAPLLALSLATRHHRFPARLESMIFSTSVSVGRARAKATASATCVALIIFSRGHVPSTRSQISVSVAEG